MSPLIQRQYSFYTNDEIIIDDSETDNDSDSDSDYSLTPSDIMNNENDDICFGLKLTLFFIKKFLDTFDFNNLTQLLFARIRLQNNLK